MKIGNLYNLDAFKTFKDSASAGQFKDSYAGTLLARSLTAVNPKVFEKKYPELSFISSGIVADNTGGYSRRIQSLRVRELGGFAQSGDMSGNKGKISLTGEDSYIGVIEEAARSTWSDSEIEEAKLGNINLVDRHLTAHNKIYLQDIDKAGLLGVNGNEGLLNYSGFTTGAAAGAIDTLTAQGMYDAYAGLLNEQKNAVNNTPEYTASVVTTPIYCINKMQSTMLNTANGSSSVLRALQDNFPGVKFVGTFRADEAAGVGVSATVAHSVSDEAMVMRIPLPLKVGEIIKVDSFDFTMSSKYRVAGLDVLEDTAGRILTGL